jgi:hypothetical protein
VQHNVGSLHPFASRSQSFFTVKSLQFSIKVSSVMQAVKTQCKFSVGSAVIALQGYFDSVFCAVVNRVQCIYCASAQPGIQEGRAKARPLILR